MKHFISLLTLIILLSSAAVAQVGLPWPGPGTPAAAGSAATPGLYYHVASSTNPVGLGIPGRAFILPSIEVPPLGTIVLGITYVHGKTITVTDTLGLTWPAAACSADGGTGNYVTAVYAINANNGSTTTDKITVGIGASNSQPFQYVISVYGNLATSGVTDGSKCTASLTPSGTALISPGAFTPTTNNNAAGGHVIWNYTAPCGSVGANPTNWVANTASGFTLLSGDIDWLNNQGFPWASQWVIQTTNASITASITSTGDTTDCFNSATVALKVANNSYIPPSTIHVLKVIHESGNIFNGSHALPTLFPTTGNLRVLTTTWEAAQPGGGPDAITGVTSSDGCTWTEIDATGAPVFYAQNCSPSATEITTLAFSAAANSQFSYRLYDITGAAASSFQNSVDSGQFACGTSLTAEPSITPTGATSGLTIANMGNGNGPITAITSPTGNFFNLWLYTSQTDTDLADNADSSAYYYYASKAAQSWNYTKTHGSDVCYGGAADFN